MMAANSLMPYIPRLLTEKVPPVNSAGFSLPAFACAHTVTTVGSTTHVYLRLPKI